MRLEDMRAEDAILKIVRCVVNTNIWVGCCDRRSSGGRRGKADGLLVDWRRCWYYKTVRCDRGFNAAVTHST